MSPLIVGIAGGTGSGKTTLAQKIVQSVPESVQIIEHDSYYRDRSELPFEERASVNFDHPDALETELLVSHLKALKAGRPVEVPSYDFVAHCRRHDTTAARPAPVIVVEGILTLADPSLRALFDIKLFVDTDADIRVFRRVRRDMGERGRTFESVREQYYTTVRPMHLQYVEPSKRFADVVILEGSNNSVVLDLLLTKVRDVAAGK